MDEGIDSSSDQIADRKVPSPSALSLRDASFNRRDAAKLSPRAVPSGQTKTIGPAGDRFPCQLLHVEAVIEHDHFDAEVLARASVRWCVTVPPESAEKERELALANGVL